MKYGKKPRLHYEKPKPKVLKRLWKRGSMFSPSYTRSKTGRPASTQVANVMDVTHFLAKYLSGNQNVIVNPQPYHGGFSASIERLPSGKQVYHINVPHWDEYDLPVKGFDKYRVYREGVWHESCHVRFTPQDLFDWGGSAIEKDVLNVLEDRRIEDLGVKEWPGYIPERLYAHAYAYALRPSVDAMAQHQAPHAVRYEAFIQRLLIGKVKGKLDPKERKMVEETAKYVEKKLEELKKEQDWWQISEEMKRLTREVIKKLQLPDSFVPPVGKGSHSSWTDTFSEDYAKISGATSKDVEKGIEEFFKEKQKQAKKREREDGKTPPTEITQEDIEKAREGTQEVKSEYQKVQKQAKVDPTLFGWNPVISQGTASLYRDERFISTMNTFLQSWKTGYKAILGKSGSRLSIPDYIRHQDEPFVTRLKQSVRGKKLLVVADFSGSMRDRQEDYKKAIISAMEVLNSIGCKLALFGFGTDPAQGDLFFRVKTFEEPRWSNTHSAKVAALQAGYACTPTDTAYVKLMNYIKKHKPEATVTITDGAPDSFTQTVTAVNNLKKHTRMVAFGIADPQGRERMENDLRQLSYHKSFVVTNVHEIPPKLVKLLTG